MSEQKQVRIVSDGSIGGTKVVDAETGEAISRVVSVDWHAGWQDDEDKLAGPPVATIKTLFAGIDVVTDAEVTAVCPECGGEGWIEELVYLRKELASVRDENRILKGRIEQAIEGR